MELKRENYDEVGCRDYKEELARLEKALYLTHDENEKLRAEVEALKECIVNMARARYLHCEP